MAQRVWCVFQRLPGESCPGLAAVCASREAAETLVRISEKDEAEQGRPLSAWTIRSWGVLDGEVGKIDDIQHISDVLDPMREGVLPVEEESAAGGEDPHLAT
ncbi:MAG TPA: hypothetical protein VHG28_09160 [Longimicrobiaceae bacterium]|nr:hypothetical protein [Longimicrobiaceae bacterium]